MHSSSFDTHLSMLLESMKIGGLQGQVRHILRRAFLSRQLAPSVIEQLGLRHTKGLLLYGPPGTGKTLLARNLAKLLNSRPPTYVNGPEILDRLVGGSEAAIRKLFDKSEREWRNMKHRSKLHVIIFDEIDALCAKRSASGSGSGTCIPAFFFIIRSITMTTFLCHVFDTMSTSTIYFNFMYWDKYCVVNTF